MINIETASDLNALSHKDSVSFTAYITSIDFVTSSKGTTYAQGSLEMNGKVSFKVWSGSLFNRLKGEDIVGGIYDCEGEVNDYNGTRSLILKDISDEPLLDREPSEFLYTPYNPDKYMAKIKKSLLPLLSDNGLDVFNHIMETPAHFDTTKTYKEYFMVSTAAVSHHDAYISGLIAHSTKVAHILSMVLRMYPNLNKTVNTDVMILGAIMHDLGKMMEYTGVSMSEIGNLCSHLSLSVEILTLFREYIIDKLGQEGYYRLQSVVTQHHGMYGDRPRTLEAWVVHKVDALEAEFQGVEESLEKGDTPVRANIGQESVRLR